MYCGCYLILPQFHFAMLGLRVANYIPQAPRPCQGRHCRRWMRRWGQDRSLWPSSFPFFSLSPLGSVLEAAVFLPLARLFRWHFPPLSLLLKQQQVPRREPFFGSLSSGNMLEAASCGYLPGFLQLPLHSCRLLTLCKQGPLKFQVHFPFSWMDSV